MDSVSAKEPDTSKQCVINMHWSCKGGAVETEGGPLVHPAGPSCRYWSGLETEETQGRAHQTLPAAKHTFTLTVAGGEVSIFYK